MLDGSKETISRFRSPEFSISVHVIWKVSLYKVLQQYYPEYPPSLKTGYKRGLMH